AMDAILVQGWVRTGRDAKGFSFMEVRDGACPRGIQVSVDAKLPADALLHRAGTRAAVAGTARRREERAAWYGWDAHDKSAADAAPPGSARYLPARFLRPAVLSHREPPVGGRDIRLRAIERLYARPPLPRRELQHLAPRGRVLDDRAGDGLL